MHYNKVILAGEIDSKTVREYEVYKTRYIQYLLNVRRLSGVVDKLPCFGRAERMRTTEGQIRIKGRIKTWNERDKTGSHLKIAVEILEEEEYEQEENQIEVGGAICRAAVKRETPAGRFIADTIVAVNRENKRETAYIPTICWGRNAGRAEKISVGKEIEIKGRLQSREYYKKMEEECQTKTAYELSAGVITERRE